MIREPRHDLVHRSGNGARGYGGAVDHDDRYLQGAGGVEFGAGAGAASVFRNDMGDAVIAQEGGVGGFVEGSFGDYDRRVGQGKRGFGGVDEAQEVMVLRFAGKGLQGLLADGEEDAGGVFWQGAGGGFGGRDMGPVVGACGAPRRAFEGEERGLRLRAGGYGVRAHRCREGVGGVDDVGNALGLQVAGEALGATVASGPCGQGLGDGGVGSTGIGKDGVDAEGGQSAGEKARFGGAAEEEDARHG